jgi:Cys-rich repeat protein
MIYHPFPNLPMRPALIAVAFVAIALPLLLAACTRDVEGLAVYDRCFDMSECDGATGDGCFRLIGETTTLGVCSVYCTAEPCPDLGQCSDQYEREDGAVSDPICVEPCTTDTDCPSGGFVCRGGSCLPP